VLRAGLRPAHDLAANQLDALVRAEQQVVDGLELARFHGLRLWG
jgi:hypothetical protein